MQGQGARGQSETLGVVLLLGMTVLSVTALAAFGGTAIDDTQHSVDVQSAEHALSQLDSRASLVALSDADSQSVSLGRGRQGTYSVDPGAGHITISHVNYTENESLELYNRSLGAVRYEAGDTTLAYQGGGVWRTRRGAGSVMVSSPEFHYRGLTLTLPILRIDGGGSIAGTARADLRGTAKPTPIYPDADEYYEETGENFTNPVQNGTVKVTVQSDYYDAWANYFRTRTDGEVRTYSGNKTAVIELVSTGTYGDFDMPMDGQPMELRALGDDHPLSDLTITIAPDDQDSAQFSDLSWALYAEDGNQKFEMSMRLQGDGSPESNVSTVIYYTNGTAEQGWYSDSAFEVTENDDGQARIVANLTGNSTMTYQDVGASELTKYKGNDDFAETVTFDEHEIDGNRTFEEDVGTADIGYVMAHYVELFGPNVDLVVKDGVNAGGGASGSVNEDASRGSLLVDGSGKYVTYLHVSENNVTVTLR